MPPLTGYYPVLLVKTNVLDLDDRGEKCPHICLVLLVEPLLYAPMLRTCVIHAVVHRMHRWHYLIATNVPLSVYL
jgi:hypothetical protein